MSDKPIIIGIAGPTASGKSCLANTIVGELGSDQVVIIHEDSYYRDQSHLAMEDRGKVNYDHPDTFEHELFFEHLLELQKGNTVKIPQYDHTEHVRTPNTISIGQHRIIVLEGIMLFVEEKLRELMDIRIFIDTPLDVCLARRLKRDIVERGRTIESVLDQYQATVRPSYFQFIEPSKRHANIIVPGGGENRVAIDMIKAKMRELLI